ncbi:hypothetical protein Lysil_1472 [Lysobacter silvestris]|uniref:General secretion pathway protein N n=1 Tax=Solilutibacter silvestris TaxID=1645665 RepID=A0A2K1Q4A3_9GAMM|nr:hypothetical protein Lysil_1472 [Lysobacter silvestris]
MSLRILPLPTLALLGLSAASLGFLGWILLPGARSLPLAAAAPQPSVLSAYAVGRMLPVASVSVADPAWSHPLFFRDRKPHVASLMDTGSVPQIATFDATLTGIIRSNTLNMASLQCTGASQPTRVRLGQEVPDAPGWRLVALTTRTARFRSGDDEKVLKLEVARLDGPAPPPSPAATTVPPVVANTSGQSTGGSEKQQSVPPPLVTNSMPPPKPTALTQQQQVDAVRQRVDAARKAMHQPSSTANH